MKKHSLLLIFIFLHLTSHAQKYHKVYLSLKTYQKKYNTTFKEIDPSLVRIIDNDTLIHDKNYVQSKGVSVPYEYKDETFLKYYKKVAFNHPNDSVSKKTRMKYWKDDIRIFFSKSVSSKTRKKLMKFANTIAKQVDSLNIYETSNVEKSNYVIYYFGDYEYESRMINYKNSDFYMYWNGKSQIYRNAIKLDSKRYFNEELRLHQLKKYLLQTIGYFKFIDDFNCESYFSNCYSKNKKLTDLDIELLKYHYSYGICKGTDLETFEKQHKRAKEILEKTNRKTRYFHSE